MIIKVFIHPIAKGHVAPVSSLNCHSTPQASLSILLTKTAEFRNSSPTSFKMQASSCWQDFIECKNRHGRTLPETKRERSQVKTSCGLAGQGRHRVPKWQISLQWQWAAPRGSK